MSQRHPTRSSSAKLIEQFDEQFQALNNDERDEVLRHVQKRISENEEKIGSHLDENRLYSRIFLLCVLLILQSGSSFILQSFAELISRHILITMYLTMLVGAGGNAGNQAAVLMIRRLANPKSFLLRSVIVRETFAALIIGCAVTLVGFLRVAIEERGAILPSLTIGLALFSIVTSSILLGTLLPVILQRVFHLDPAHAGPIIQVLMDILGVCITCAIGQMLLVNKAFSKNE